MNYYLAVAEGALGGAGGRPNVLVRYPNGLGEEFFYQKRAPDSRPDWIEVVALKFPSGRTAEEVVPRDAAALAWMANLACIELHPHPVRAEELDHPDELRVDLDPVPGVEWRQVQDVAKVVRAVLDDLGLIGWPKTSGSRGIHVNVRIHQRWTFNEVRRAAVALAREVERRAPAIATSKWWKEERHGVFIDYNQNAKDRTVCSAFSVRPRPDARVSTPLTWDEIDACDPADFTMKTMPAWFKSNGDRHAEIDSHPCSLEKLLELSAKQEKEGQGDAPWPPQYKKMPGEPTRVQPSRARRGRQPQEGVASTAEGTGPRTQDPRPKTAGTGRRVSKHPLIVIAHSTKKEEALESLEKMEGREPERRRAPSARRHPDRFHARAIVKLVADPHQPAARARGSCAPSSRRCRRSRIPGLTRILSRLGTEDRSELVSRSNLELIVAAVLRRLVVTPAQERRGMTEAIALHVVVLHLAHALDAERLPRQVLAGAPSAVAAWHALANPRHLFRVWWPPWPRPTRARDARPSRPSVAARAPRRVACVSPS